MRGNNPVMTEFDYAVVENTLAKDGQNPIVACVCLHGVPGFYGDKVTMQYGKPEAVSSHPGKTHAHTHMHVRTHTNPHHAYTNSLSTIASCVLCRFDIVFVGNRVFVWIPFPETLIPLSIPSLTLTPLLFGLFILYGFYNDHQKKKITETRV